MTKTSRSLGNLGEFAWLRRLLPKLFWPSSLDPQLCIGPGDDAGVLRISRQKALVATTDAMVEGVHFERAWFPWEALGEKILAVNLSDLAAMGKVRPLAALVTVAMPGDTPVDCVDKFYKGLESCARRWKVGLLGGDTVGSKAGWFLSLTLLGEADPRRLLTRQGARPGDWVVVTGALGQAAAGLEALQTGRQGWTWTKPLVQAFTAPQPRFLEAAVLGETQWATSLMDSSDGLEASVRLLAEASGGLGAEIEIERLPVSRPLQRWADHQRRPVSAYALSGGEDYELVFTVPPKRWAALRKRIPRATVVGRVLPKGKGCWALDRGRRRPLKGYGYSHFKAS